MGAAHGQRHRAPVTTRRGRDPRGVRLAPRRERHDALRPGVTGGPDSDSGSAPGSRAAAEPDSGPGSGSGSTPDSGSGSGPAVRILLWRYSGPGPTDLPTSRPTGHPTDRPTSHPTGRPTDRPAHGPAAARRAPWRRTRPLRRPRHGARCVRVGAAQQPLRYDEYGLYTAVDVGLEPDVDAVPAGEL
ncbi:PT domain-containing protein [Streptomyces sp. RG80]|uniref:PT domain-containing protein n=1 Tax=Streptomyces sp. RG80 TaxID=3157340 RepID=UPI00338D3C65